MITWKGSIGFMSGKVTYFVILSKGFFRFQIFPIINEKEEQNKTDRSITNALFLF